MRTLHRWFQLLALLTVALVLSACGGGGSTEKEAPTHTVSATSSTGGSISPASRNVAHSASATFTVTPDTGFSIDRVSGCNGALVGDTYRTGPITSACTVSAAFTVKPEPTKFTLEGRVLNGALVGSTVEALSANGRNVLGTATTDGDGRYTAEVSEQGPYRVRASGGKLNGVDYTGALESFCAAGSDCFVTPYTTVVQRLVDEHHFNPDDAVGHLVKSPGFGADPFTGVVPVDDSDLDAARKEIAGGDGLDAWVESVAAWVTGEVAKPPAGIQRYTLTYTAGPNGSLEGDTEQTVAHGASGSAVTAVPDTGYSFTQWSDALTDNPRADSNVTGELSVSASFALNSYTISGTAEDGGSISPTSQEVDHGTTAEFEVTPETGYSIDTVTGCNGSLDANTYTIGAITAACSVSATFALNEYTISTTSGPGGSIDPASRVVPHGAEASFTVTPDIGYRIDTVSGCSGSLAGDQYVIGAVTEPCTVSATFELLRYTLTYTAGPNGSLEGDTEQTVAHGASGTAVTAVPDTGYAFTQWSDASTDNPRTDSNVTGELSASASFALNRYTVSATAGNGGSISPTRQEVDHGNTAQFTLTPETGYSIDQVEGCNGTLNGSIYTTDSITEPCTITATFLITLQPPTNVTAEPGDGQVTISWDAAPDAQTYNVYWSNTSGIHPHTAASYDGFQAAVTSPHVVNGLQNGEDCFFIVTSVSGLAESLASEEASAQPRYRFVISHPYSDINWQHYEQHKANLHTHTRESDGDSAPDVVIDRYRALGYTILSLTDHDTWSPESTTWPWTDYGRNPGSLGMIAIQGNEISRPHHIGSYYNDYGDASETSAERAIVEIGQRNGLAVLFHPGRYNYTVSWYVDLYRKYPHLIGLEVYNQRDRYPGDRATWDAILTEVALERPVWAFANDDMHRIDRDLGFNWNVMLIPELTDAHVREAMENGRFFFVHSPHGHDAEPPPEVLSIVVDGATGLISVDAKQHERIDWISNGSTIHSGGALFLPNVSDVGSYVRAVIHADGSDAVLGTQAFRLLPR